MTDKLPDHETIEAVIETAPKALIAKLPDTTESRRAAEHIDLAYKYVKEARERARPETSSLTVETRGPALLGWPWAPDHVGQGANMSESESIAFCRGYDLATARAESRQRLGLPIERGNPYTDRIRPVEQNEGED